ncbi:MAG: phenylalanine--tRNA ligase subunit beta [Candidatus Melainabacteria bacterium]|nr:phenylalanine--tRNA ligase subunit beta [Candidatus Melainabacteria bacterium]
MKLSYNWLKDFLDLSGTNPEELSEKLTMSAFEVEGIEATGAVLGHDVVLGQIKQIDKHPDADKLQVTQTAIGFDDDGSEIIEQIVCGANNIAVGQQVPVAIVGATVSNRHDGSELKIKKSKIRGVESKGMLCSADELGFSEAAIKSIKEKQGDGIYILDSNEKIGTPLAKVLKQEPDYVLDVGARSNRGDALSVYGQAREMAAVLDCDCKQPVVKEFKFDSSVASVKPLIKDENDCQLFYTIAVEGVEIKESPEWLQERINAMGTKSINNVVDISNYVLLELGQPMHFYDREKISGGFLEVRRAKAGEKLVTLEEQEEELSSTNLVIADQAGPSSLAGVMGGLDSSINDGTTNLVIEVAVFSPALVRKSSRAAGVESESKRRFERGVDRAMSRTALLRAVNLLEELACPEGGSLRIGEIQVAGSETIPGLKLKLRPEQVERQLGIKLDADHIVSLLERLGVRSLRGGVTKQSNAKDPALDCFADARNDVMEFSIPSYRQMDITREVDLIEEIGRLYGFSNIPVCAPGSSSSVVSEQTKQVQTKTKIREAFVAAGFAEASLSSLIGDSLVALDSVSPELIGAKRGVSIEMDNPLSREHRVLRQSMLPGLIQAASRNYAYDKSIDIKLFELGKVYHYQGEGEADAQNAKEENKFAAILVKTEVDWTQSKSKTLAENFFGFKSIVENLFPRARFAAIESAELAGNSFVHPGISAIISQDNRTIGLIAKLHPSIRDEWDLPDESYVLELDHPQLAGVKFKPIASTPITERDITVDSADDISCDAIETFISKSKLKDLKAVKLHSLYRRADEKEASKSSTFRLKFQSDTETLTGEVIDAEIEKLKSKLEADLGVAFRA